MLSYTDLTKGVMFEMDDEPYIVLEYTFLRMQQRKPTVQTKLKNLITGKIVQKSFQGSDVFEEAEIDKMPIVYLYKNKPARNAAHSAAGGDEYWFIEKGNPKNRFSFKEEQIADQAPYLLPNMEVMAYKFDEKIINIELPVKMDYKVIEAPPSYKGDTATGGSKTVTLENGLNIQVPMFISEGDVIRVNTTSGEYTERAEKK